MSRSELFRVTVEGTSPDITMTTEREYDKSTEPLVDQFSRDLALIIVSLVQDNPELHFDAEITVSVPDPEDEK